MSYDGKAKDWIDKSGVTDKKMKEQAIENGTPQSYTDFEVRKMSHAQTKKEHKDKESELLERTIMGIDDPATAGYDAAYNLGINERVMERVNQAASDFKMDAFGSDAEIVEYYKNYDKIKAQEKAEVQAGYKAAYERERALENSKANLEISKASLESNYEAAALKAKESKPNLLSRFASFGSSKDEGKVGTIVDDFLDFD